MDICTFEELFNIIRIGLRMSGLTLNKSKPSFRFYFMLFNLTLMIFEEFAFFISKCKPESLLEVTQLTPCLCIGLLSALKIVPIAVKRNKIFKLTSRLQQLHEDLLLKPKGKGIIRDGMNLMRIFLKYFAILNSLLVSCYNFSSPMYMIYMYVKTKEITYNVPYGVIVPFPINNWLNWFVVYIHSIAVGFICVLFFTTVDSLYCVLTLHICNNFSVLSDEIQRLDETNTHLLRGLLIDHQNILKLSEDLEEIFRLPNLFSVLVGSLEICALGFNLTMGDWSQVPGCILFLLSVLLQILMMSVFGENIIRESKKVGESAFLNKWYEMDTKSKKMILILMKRSFKAQKLTAYKFSVICYESFTKIISTSWSYFTILRTVYKPPEQAA